MDPQDQKFYRQRRQDSLPPLLLTHNMFFGDLRSSRTLDGITLSHRVANSPPDEVIIHTHVDAHYVLVTSGHYVSSAGGTPKHKKVLIYNPPGTTHRDHFHQGKGSFFTISVTPQRVAESTDSKLPAVATHLDDDRASGLATALLTECARWNKSSGLKAESLYFELIATTLPCPVLVGRSRPPWLRAAYELIQDCYLDDLSIRQIANMAGVHPTHLARVFRSFFGCSPGDLLHARRLEKAAELLLSTQTSIAQIALAAGYSDQAQFTKAFCRMYGTPPGGYRRLSSRVLAKHDVAF